MADYQASPYNLTDDTPATKMTTRNKAGRVRVLTGTIETAAGYEPNDTITFGKIPSNARILPDSKIYHDNITGGGDVNLGSNDSLGSSPENKLVDAANLATASSPISAMSNVDNANLTKELWELLGMSEDPCKEIDIQMECVSNISTAGTITLDLRYVVD